MTQLRCVKGMHDILPEDMPKWHFLEDKYRELVARFGYSEIRTPILEPLDLFIRGIGEATDIVEKEMYAFRDKGNACLALRPEGTASVVRSFVQHNLGGLNPINKMYYIGPMFRRERPAKGRYRQFYQAGAELIGVDEPTADAEVIDMAVQFVESLGIKNIKVQINSLGDGDSRQNYKAALVDHFGSKKQELCADCNRRIDLNPLRVLDCKNEKCKTITKDAPSILEYISDASKDHFEEIKRLLDLFKTRYEVVPTMVRGLDYYTRTIFEIQGDSSTLGAQATIVGGGRYNGLVKELGGRQTPTVGFAFGIERLLLMLGEDAKEKFSETVFVAGIGDGGFDRAINIARNLRKSGFKVETLYRVGSLRSQLKRADKYKATIAIIAGEDEAARGAVTWRNMNNGNQEEVLIDDIEKRLGEIK